jgi:DNA-binding phage protein
VGPTRIFHPDNDLPYPYKKIRSEIVGTDHGQNGPPRLRNRPWIRRTAAPCLTQCRRSGFTSARLAGFMSDNPTRLAEKLANVLRARSTQLGLPHLEVDHRAGLAQGHFNKILNGKKNPTLGTIERIYRALKLDFVAPVPDDASETIIPPQ